MAIKSEPVCRSCRRVGMKLYLKGQKCYTEKCPFEKKTFPPGQHGRKKKIIRLSDYGVRLSEKQKLKKFYFMREEQFRKFFDMALRAKGNTGNRFIELLERRLDNVVFRAGFGLSRRHARQLVSHGHIKVNGRKVDRPSYLVDVGDEIEIVSKELIPSTPVLKVPSWIESDLKEGKAKIIRLPERKDLDLRIDETLIIEFYSR